MSAAPSPSPTTPTEGALDPITVPQLLAEAWRDRSSGCLQLAHGKRELRIFVHEGAPIGTEAGRHGDDLARLLQESGQITVADRMRVEKFAAERECPQASAALALKLVEAGALYKSMRGHARTLICESFEWRQGHYRWTALETDGRRLGKPFDLLSLLQSQLPKRWDSQRLFETLMPQSTCFVELVPRFRSVARKLAQGSPLAERVIARLDGSAQIGQILGEAAGDPLAAATLWTLIHTGLVRLLDRRASRLVEAELDIEVVVDDANRAAADRPATRKRAGSGDEDKARARGEAMREEIEALLDQLADLDYYAALGLEANANAVEIKKAYFKAAKRYHPDALARVGVGDLREEASRVFARMAEAFETLSDPTKKAAYDAGAGDEPEIDMARLAQAEKSFRKGEILLRMGNFVSALEYLEPAVELWPEEPAYQAALGWALYRQPQADPARAREHLAIAHEQAPEEVETLFRLGVVLRAVGESESGDQCVARARALDPTVED